MFEFDDACLEAFDTLKRALVSASVLQIPNSNEPFEIMCDASNFVMLVTLRWGLFWVKERKASLM